MQGSAGGLSAVEGGSRTAQRVLAQASQGENEGFACQMQRPVEGQNEWRRLELQLSVFEMSLRGGEQVLQGAGRLMCSSTGCERKALA